MSGKKQLKLSEATLAQIQLEELAREAAIRSYYKNLCFPRLKHFLVRRMTSPFTDGIRTAADKWASDEVAKPLLQFVPQLRR